MLFWRTLGEYTEEELKIAVDEMNAGRLPKQVFVFFKEPDNGISNELAAFKCSFSQNYPAIPVLIFNDAKSLRNLVSTLLLPQ